MAYSAAPIKIDLGDLLKRYDVPEPVVNFITGSGFTEAIAWKEAFSQASLAEEFLNPVPEYVSNRTDRAQELLERAPARASRVRGAYALPPSGPPSIRSRLPQGSGHLP